MQLPCFVSPAPGCDPVLLDEYLVWVPGAAAPCWLTTLTLELDEELGLVSTGGIPHLQAAQEGQLEAAATIGGELAYRALEGQLVAA